MKKLIKHIRNNNEKISKLENVYFYYPDTNINHIKINTLIDLYKNNKKFIIVDGRSESEFEKDNLPNSINFPILNNQERKEVGFLYKQFSKKAALFRANEHAEKKLGEIEEFANYLNSKNTKVFVYCWRGGKRSSALIHFLKRFKCECTKLTGGYKAYRNVIYKLFYETPEKLNFVPLTGLTGCGKTEIIEDLNGIVPVFDIEKAASHASSLFGKIRYNVKNCENIDSQTKFENSLFKQTLQISKYDNLPFLTEGESKRINKFMIPGPLFEKLIESPSIRINCSIDLRVKRIVREYFKENGAKEVYKIVENSNYLKQILGKEKRKELLKLIELKEYEQFTHWFLTNYYDKKYANKYKNTIAEINTDNIEKAKEEILEILRKNVTLI